MCIYIYIYMYIYIYIYIHLHICKILRGLHFEIWRILIKRGIFLGAQIISGLQFWVLPFLDKHDMRVFFNKLVRMGLSENGFLGRSASRSPFLSKLWFRMVLWGVLHLLMTDWVYSQLLVILTLWFSIPSFFDEPLQVILLKCFHYTEQPFLLSTQ